VNVVALMLGFLSSAIPCVSTFRSWPLLKGIRLTHFAEAMLDPLTALLE
jgi:hypothetical protein